jgi:LysM repeat protein
MRKLATIAFVGLFVFANSAQLSAQSLKGSRTAMRRQNSVALEQDFTFLRTTSDVWRFVDKGLLVKVKNTGSLKLSEAVSFPYARGAVKTFAERLASQYKDACGEKLVVTSLTRPLSRQPWNASDLSVHPAGMALDIRVSQRRACRRFLEQTLVSLENKRVLDATRERFPAHYHVAVFPAAYQNYVSRLSSSSAKFARNSTKEAAKTKMASAAQPQYASIMPLTATASRTHAPTHKVRKGETLWTIAEKHNVSVTALKKTNGLHSSRIRAGQVLAIPGVRSSAD